MKLGLLFSSLILILVACDRQFTAPSDYRNEGHKEWQSDLQKPAEIRDAKSAIRNDPHPPTLIRDPHCPGTDNAALLCHLVNEYRAKHGLRPVQLDDAVTREAQYWSDQLTSRNACWFLYHDYNYHARMRARFPGRRFRENAACSGSTGGGAEFILQKWIDSTGHRENMLTLEWRTIGVGVTKNIWVIDFTD